MRTIYLHQLLYFVSAGENSRKYLTTKGDSAGEGLMILVAQFVILMVRMHNIFLYLTKK